MACEISPIMLLTFSDAYKCISVLIWGTKYMIMPTGSVCFIHCDDVKWYLTCELEWNTVPLRWLMTLHQPGETCWVCSQWACFTLLLFKVFTLLLNSIKMCALSSDVWPSVRFGNQKARPGGWTKSLENVKSKVWRKCSTKQPLCPISVPLKMQYPLMWTLQHLIYAIDKCPLKCTFASSFFWCFFLA